MYAYVYVRTYTQISALAAFLSCSLKNPQTAAWPTADGGIVQQRKNAKIAKFLLTCTVYKLNFDSAEKMILPQSSTIQSLYSRANCRHFFLLGALRKGFHFCNSPMLPRVSQCSLYC